MLQYLVCVEAPPQFMGKGGHVWRKSDPDQGGHRCYHKLCQKHHTINIYLTLLTIEYKSLV